MSKGCGTCLGIVIAISVVLIFVGIGLIENQPCLNYERDCYVDKPGRGVSDVKVSCDEVYSYKIDECTSRERSIIGEILLCCGIFWCVVGLIFLVILISHSEEEIYKRGYAKYEEERYY